MSLSYPDGYDLESGVFYPRGNKDTESFTYSDGEDFEKKIEKIISAAKDRSLFSPEIVDSIWDWRSSCHLSPGRSNLLRPLRLLFGGRILELGAGCGPITRYIGELGSEVVALEASAFRAGTTRLRTSDLPNVSVVCDRIEHFDSTSKFDAVIMVGVLQYSRLFSNSGAFAEMRLLENAARQLKANGVLVLAIQNKLGLKYFAGLPEANIGTPYFGIENKYGDDTVIRFGLKELKEKLSIVGLKCLSVVLPMPDYHMPVVLFSSKAAHASDRFAVGDLLATSVGYDRVRPDWRRPTFSLERAWQTIQQNGLLETLSNAFLIVAGKTPASIAAVENMEELAWHYSTVRHPSFATETRFFQNNNKIAIQRSRLHNFPAPKVPIRQKIVAEPYRVGRLWWLELVAIVNRPGWTADEISRWATPWIDALLKKAGIKSLSAASFTKRVDGTLFDATPTNLVQGLNGDFHFFDQEWRVQSPLSLGFIVFRGLLGSLSLISSCSLPAAGIPVGFCDLIKLVLHSMGISLTEQDRDRYLLQEIRIQRWVVRGKDEPKHPTVLRDLQYFQVAALDPRSTLDLPQAHAVLADRDARVAELESALAAVNARVNELLPSLVAREAQISELQSSLVAHHTQLTDLNSSLFARDTQILELQSSLVARHTQLTDLNSSLFARDTQISELQSSLVARNTQLTDLNSALTARDAQISELQSSLIANHTQLTDLNSALIARDTQISELQSSLVACQAQLTDLSSSLIARDTQISELQSSLFANNVRLTELRSLLAARGALVLETQSLLAARHAELVVLQLSTGARVERFIRSIGQKLRRVH
jgi:SAM-dependent methyltransferase/predicted  nucleic acid-binding Zn-ribbon protein